jgi:hypothetical protein
LDEYDIKDRGVLKAIQRLYFLKKNPGVVPAKWQDIFLKRAKIEALDALIGSGVEQSIARDMIGG